MIFPEKVFNPFEGRNKDEVWAEIKAKKQPVDKVHILAEMKQKLIIKRDLI